MKPLKKLEFKIASEVWEFNEIHALNYRTFVEEIPQHPGSEDKALIDKFNVENVYIICICEQRLLGMIAVRDTRPFSLDAKLKNLDTYLPESNSICEIRLLSIEKNRRHGRVIQGLVVELGKYCDEKKYDLAIISGTLRQTKLYRHFGFEVFGPVVGTEDAQYQPMYLTLDSYHKLKNEARVFKYSQPKKTKSKVNFLPGPVEIKKDVMKAYRRMPVSHRTDEFVTDFKNTKNKLCKILNCNNTALFMGSGTLANDVVAGQLSLLNEKGLLLVSGEFSRRLVEHAKAVGLEFEILKIDDGEAFVSDEIDKKLQASKDIQWVWGVHCETSTGVVNDISLLLTPCLKNQVKLCLDCISSIGTMSVDLSKLYLATGVSGKGLGALPGLSMVFFNHDVHPSPDTLLRYTDLGLYAQGSGIPFTLSSNLLYALKTSLTVTNWPEQIDDINIWMKIILRRIVGMGYRVVSKQAEMLSAVISIDLPDSVSSKYFGSRAENEGFYLSFHSDYLIQKNRIQICLMRQPNENQIKALLMVFEKLAVEFKI